MVFYWSFLKNKVFYGFSNGLLSVICLNSETISHHSASSLAFHTWHRLEFRSFRNILRFIFCFSVIFLLRSGEELSEPEGREWRKYWKMQNIRLIFILRFPEKCPVLYSLDLIRLQKGNKFYNENAYSSFIFNSTCIKGKLMKSAQRWI